MKRTLQLCIGHDAVYKPADTGDDTFVLYNCSNGDLTEPAQIKNSWSRQITLPGTPANDIIFGGMNRHDRATNFRDPGGNGIYFDPSVRTPFQLFDDTGALVDDGYLKLDEIVEQGPDHSYKVTLYGGLGGFLYSLSYDEYGNRRSLADLVYKAHFSEGGAVQDLGFTINYETVRDAWDFLSQNGGPHYLKDNKWDFINFAPCYNGYPSGQFSADKVLVDAQRTGLPFIDGDFHPYGSGRTVLVSLPSKKTEWEVGDLRSYLQRPVLRFGAVLAAIADPENNGGYEVELDETIFDPVLANNGYVWGTWLTLPLLTTMKVHRDPGAATSFAVIVGQNPIPTNVGAATDFRIEVAPKIGAGTGDRYLHTDYGALVVNWIEVKATFYDSHGLAQLVKTVRFGSLVDGNAQPVAQITNVGHFDASGNWTGAPAVFEWSNPEGIGNETYARVDIAVTDGSYVAYGYSDPLPGYVWNDPDDYDDRTAYTDTPQLSGQYNVSGIDGVRSNVPVSAADLLKTEHTPAEYLLSFVKMLGLRLFFDPARKKVTVSDRGYRYAMTPIDLTRRINRGKPLTTTPLAFDKRWYQFGLDYSRGEWAQYYKNKYGFDFGDQRVDTGYDFDAGTKAVMEGVIFRGAVQILERSKFFMQFANGGTYPPGVFLDQGATYDLFDYSGNTKQMPVPFPRVGGTPLNPTYPGFDLFDKPQFHNADNAGYDERDTLILFDGMVSFTSGTYILTDDTQLMMQLNNDTPCWNLASGYSIAEAPHFTRYGRYCLDFGIPAEIPVPDLDPSNWTGIYGMRWRSFIGDRLDVNTRVVRCWVNWDGYQVGPDLLKNFYWFDGAIWSLNKIINYSLTTWDDTECEFIRVQNKINYY